MPTPAPPSASTLEWWARQQALRAKFLPTVRKLLDEEPALRGEDGRRVCERSFSGHASARQSASVYVCTSAVHRHSRALLYPTAMLSEPVFIADATLENTLDTCLA